MESGIVAVNDNLSLIPSATPCTVKSVRVGGDVAQYASAGVSLICFTFLSNLKSSFSGANIELGLVGIDVISLHSGAFLCDPEAPIRSVTLFSARIVTFALEYPIIQGMEVSEPFSEHFSFS